MSLNLGNGMGILTITMPREVCQYDHPQRVDSWKWFPDYLDADEDPSEFKFTVYCAIEGEDIDPIYLT